MSIWKGWAGFARSISSSSVMNPTLLTILMVTTPSLALVYFAPLPLTYFFMVMAAAPLFVGLWQICRFTLRDPYQLRNDRVTERAMELRIGSQTANGFNEVLLPATTVLIDNPKISDGERT
jgi:hypothetical protein